MEDDLALALGSCEKLVRTLNEEPPFSLCLIVDLLRTSSTKADLERRKALLWLSLSQSTVGYVHILTFPAHSALCLYSEPTYEVWKARESF